MRGVLKSQGRPLKSENKKQKTKKTTKQNKKPETNNNKKSKKQNRPLLYSIFFLKDKVTTKRRSQRAKLMKSKHSQ